jgi:hypothetical protein
MELGVQALGTTGMVHANEGQNVTPLTSSQGYVAVHFLLMKTLTDESRVARPHKKHKQPCKHHHHSGRAACASSGVDLMNTHHRKGGRPCAHHFQVCH